MFTQCPNCYTLFKISAAQLKATSGKVQCCICQEVFDGIANLDERLSQSIEGSDASEFATHSAPRDTTHSAKTRQAPPRSEFESIADLKVGEETSKQAPVGDNQQTILFSWLRAEQTFGSPESSEPSMSNGARLRSREYSGVEASKGTSVSSGGEETLTTPASVRMEETLASRIYSEDATSGDRTVAMERRGAPSRPEEARSEGGEKAAGVWAHGGRAQPEIGGVHSDEGESTVFYLSSAHSNPNAREEPTVLREMTTLYEPSYEESHKSRRDHGIAWTLGSMLLLVLLVGQYGYFKRDELVGNSALRPWIDRLCAWASCTLPVLRDPARIQLVDREVKAHPAIDNALLITVTFVNDAPFYQPFPILGFKMSDSNGKLLVQRRFLPSEYLREDTESSPGMPPKVPVSARLEVVDPSVDAVSYMFDFY
jgi:Protein of unknown function (DUF3426).